MRDFDVRLGFICIDDLIIQAGTTKEEVEASGHFEMRGGDQLAVARLTDGDISAAGASWTLTLTFVRGQVRSALLQSNLGSEKERFECARRLIERAWPDRKEPLDSDTGIILDVEWGSVSVFRCLHGESCGTDGHLRFHWR